MNINSTIEVNSIKEINWELFNEGEVSLYQQLQRGGNETWLNLEKSKYLEVLVGALNCYNLDTFKVYCNYNTAQVISDNFHLKGRREFQSYGFNILPPYKQYVLYKEVESLKLEIENILIYIHVKEEVPNNCIVCLSLNGESNINEVKVKDTKINNRTSYWLINPTNSLIIKFK